ncbi:MAG: hypothetical protein FWG89_10295 [Treponema sp.]|nr:hypothetical protein [Treponema sp.]
MLKKAGTLLTMAVVFFVLLAVGLAGCGDEGEIFLEAGSQGRPGNSTVYDLEPGTMYLVRNGITWHIVQTDGTLGSRLVQLNRPALEFALANPLFGPLDPGVTTIRGLSNGTVFSVYAFYRPDDDFYVTPDTETQSNFLKTRQKNIVVDLSLAAAFNMTAAFFSPGVIDRFSELIFVTPDIDNTPQEETITGGSPRINGGPEWEYRFDGGMASVSESQPLIIKVASSSWQRGYFSLSGEMPHSFTMFSKRSLSDPDRPPSR